MAHPPKSPGSGCGITMQIRFLSMGVALLLLNNLIHSSLHWMEDDVLFSIADTSVRTRRTKEVPTPNGPPDGFFNKFPVYYQNYQEGFHSNTHCIGENFGKDAWKFRSCQFQNLCFDTEVNEFVLFTSPEQRELEKVLMPDMWPASSMNTKVSVGGINPKWGPEHLEMKWYPSLRDVEELESQGGYYTLQSDKLLIPWHSLAGFNPGHLVWDDFLPIYTLLSAFDLTDKQLALIRFDLPPPTKAMWASCQRQWEDCAPILDKFLPLMGAELNKTISQIDSHLETVLNESKSKFVCAPNGVAGLGMLTDHGAKLHGWQAKDYEYSHNIGRGGSVYQFRNWMMDNLLGEDRRESGISKPPYRIIFSTGSSITAARKVDFEWHAALLQKRLGGKYDLDIRVVKLAEMSIVEQVQLASEASIFISAAGGGAVTAMFLPKGASLFIYYNGVDNARGGAPARLDWDLLNNIGYLRVQWMPRPKNEFSSEDGEPVSVQGAADLDAFVKLVDHELDLISHSSHRFK